MFWGQVVNTPPWWPWAGGMLARELGLTAPFWLAAATYTVLGAVAFVAVDKNRTVDEARTAACTTPGA